MYWSRSFARCANTPLPNPSPARGEGLEVRRMALGAPSLYLGAPSLYLCAPSLSQRRGLKRFHLSPCGRGRRAERGGRGDGAEGACLAVATLLPTPLHRGEGLKA